MFSETEKASMQATINALAPLIAAHDGCAHEPVALTADAAVAFMTKRDNGRAAADAAMVPILQASNWPLFYGREVHDPLFQSAQSALTPFCKCPREAHNWALSLPAIKDSDSKKIAFSGLDMPGRAVSVAKMVVADFSNWLAA